MSKLQNFDYQNVALKEGHWKKQRDELIETYLKIEDDDLLHPFRKLANLPNKGHGLVGWYGSGASTFGQKLGAFAKLYLVTGDIRLKEKAIRLADGWGECLAASDCVADCNGTYNYDKLMGGFLDLYEYLGYEPAKEYVRALTKSADARLDKEVCRDGLQIMSGDMIEWYTLPEQIYRAYQLTGEQLYLDFAKVWDYDYFWDKLLAGDFKIGPRHAYSHVNSLSSAAMAYETTKNEEYLRAIEIAYKEILDHHTFATGGYGPAECLFADEEGYLGDSIKASWDADKRHIHYRDFGNSIRQRDDRWGSCEVSCCSWAVFKLTRYLMELTGEARYGGWAEKLLYNGCGGQPPITQDGKVMYYADYFINGGLKSTEDGRLQDNGASFEWQCCTGTFPQDVAEYANLLYYHSEEGLFVSQYLPSDVTFSIGDKQVRLENTSFYPKEKELRFVVHAETPVTTALHFRVPSWATGSNTVCINKEKVNTSILPDIWLTLEREWKEGDEITISFEFVLRFESVDSYAPEVAALVYGPIVLACDKMTLFDGDRATPEEWIEPIQKDGYSFAFRTKPGHVRPYEHLTREFYPYYEIPQMQWYYMYSRFTK